MTRKALFKFIYETVIAPNLTGIKKDLIKISLPMISGGESASISNENWPDLIFAASILAQSTDAKYLEASLRVATGALLSYTSSDINDAAGILLDKLDNARALKEKVIQWDRRIFGTSLVGLEGGELNFKVI